MKLKYIIIGLLILIVISLGVDILNLGEEEL